MEHHGVWDWNYFEQEMLKKYVLNWVKVWANVSNEHQYTCIQDRIASVNCNGFSY